MTKLEMDLLDILREDCRLPLEKLAVMTGASTAEVAEAIDRMEKERIILRYSPYHQLGSDRPRAGGGHDPGEHLPPAGHRV